MNLGGNESRKERMRDRIKKGRKKRREEGR